MSSVVQARFQLFSALSPEKYEALKSDIRRHGVLVPVEVDQHGQILDGHHRVQAWSELRAEGVKIADYTRIIRHFDNDDDREEHAARVNTQHREVTTEEKRNLATRWRQHEWSYRRIADALAVSHMTVSRWIPEQDSTVTSVTVELPERSIGKDGKSRPARRPKPTVLATSAKEQERALTNMESLFSESATDDESDEYINASTGEILTASDLQRKAKEHKQQASRNEKERQPSLMISPETRAAVERVTNGMAADLIPLDMSQDALKLSGRIKQATSKLSKLPLDFRQEAITRNPSMQDEYETLIADALELVGVVREMIGHGPGVRRIS